MLHNMVRQGPSFEDNILRMRRECNYYKTLFCIEAKTLCILSSVRIK